DTQAVAEAVPKATFHSYFHRNTEHLVPAPKQRFHGPSAEIVTAILPTVAGVHEAIKTRRCRSLRPGSAFLDSDNTILASMQKLFHYTEKVDGGGLFNETVGLWRHDSGSFTFSSQANGEAFAGLAKVLAALPSTDPRRVEYLRVFRKMAGTIRLTQRPDGFWNTDLLNPLDSPGPESAGTSLLTYGLAWGVSAGVLDARTYEPAATKAWQALTSKALLPSGFLGYVQNPAARPFSPPAKATDTAAYGVGGFLQAGRWIAALTPACQAP
uniref:glycoside hydrolase family 88 protein n=1 Tax=Fodinicola feengrottensis TaxID=435914 RepID=UPI002441CB98